MKRAMVGCVLALFGFSSSAQLSGYALIDFNGLSVESLGWAEYNAFPNLCGGWLSGTHIINDGAVGTVVSSVVSSSSPYDRTVSAGSQYLHCYQARLDVTANVGTMCTKPSNTWYSATKCAPPQPPPPKNCDPYWDEIGFEWVDPDCDTPILLNLALNGNYDLTSAADGVRFDIRADGNPRQIAWTNGDSDVAFLAFDRNGNGSIDSGAELFGDATTLAVGVRASHGFQALTELDANFDGIVDRHDPSWTSLLLWTDRDHDGKSTPAELQPIANTIVEWLGTSYAEKINRRDPSGNVFRYMARFGLTNAGNRERQSTYYDVLLAQ